ncbi:MAG: DsrE family protein [Gammaproteobacteria bacterium]|nr:DsrE family protein [Gammaproteobacteria bacterium]
MRRAQDSSLSPVDIRCLAGIFAFAWLAILLAVPLPASANDDLERLLAQPDAPDGVIFEIVESDEDALQELLPRVRIAIEKIRARFPQTEFAVVSHGREEFALQTQYQAENAQIHQQVQSLVSEDVPVHVCETHAGWYGVSAEDFPAYVNVSPTGPGQIRLYQELGYELIVVE